MKQLVLVSSVAICALSAGACTSTPEPLAQLRAAAPADWAARDDVRTAPSADWVAAFEDAQLSALVAEAMDVNYNVAAAVARLEQAQAGRISARSGLLPTVSGSVDASATRSDAADFEDYGVGAQATWEADVWGRLRALAASGALNEAAAQADLHAARLSIAGAVAQGWFDLIEARGQTALAQDDVAAQERALRLTQRRYESGVAGALDVRLARSGVASAQATLAQRSNLENNAARRLEVLLGRYPSNEIEAAAALPALPSLRGAGAPGELLARRPDLIAAEARVAAAGMQAEAARKALLPSLTLTASSGTSAADAADMFDPDFLVSRAVAGVAQPLFRGGFLRAQARSAEAAQREVMAGYAQSVLSAYREVEDALDAEDALADQETALAVASTEAAAAETLAERNYTRGVGTIFELLDAQRRRISAERQLITVRKERVANRVRLNLAVGGAFAVRPNDGAGSDNPAQPET